MRTGLLFEVSVARTRFERAPMCCLAVYTPG